MNFLVLFGYFLIFCQCGFTYGQNSIPNLTMQTFQAFLKDKNVIVKFYKPGCSYCKQIQEPFKGAAILVRNDTDLDVVMAQVDAEEQYQLQEHYDINGVPTLRFFGNGKFNYKYDYKGDYIEEDIYEWIVETVELYERKKDLFNNQFKESSESSSDCN